MNVIVDIVSRLMGGTGGLRIEAANARFGIGDRILIESYHWDVGDFETEATVIARVGTDRLIVRVEGGIENLSVDARDCAVVEAGQ